MFSRSSTTKRTTRRGRLRVEPLESRLVPTVFTVTTTADVVANDGKLSLREAIGRANAHPGPDVVVLGAGTYLITLSDDLAGDNSGGDFDIAGPVTIQGQGSARTVIDGGGQQRIFEVLGKVAAAFSGLTLRNGVGLTDGGAIRAVDANLRLTGCVVSGNSAVEGGGIRDDHGNVTLVHATVVGNAAQRNGGGISVGTGALTLTDSTVTRNLAGDSGGGVAAGGAVTLTRCSVLGNHSSGSGGGVLADTATLRSSTFSRNFADQDGGGMLVRTADLIGTRLLGNLAIRGGGLFASETATLTGCAVNNNTAIGSGGGVLTVADVRVVHSSLGGNQAATGGAVIAGGAAVVTGSEFRDNEAGGDGGALFAESATIDHCVFDHNSSGLRVGSDAGGSGGAIFVRTEADISDCTISNNAANGRGNAAGGNGGGIFANDATISDSVITQNTAGGGSLSGNGGGLFANVSASVSRCTVSGNRATGDGLANGNGGGINANTVTVSQCTITGNTAHGRNADSFGSGNGGGGGGIFARDIAVVQDSTIRGNAGVGGGIGGGSVNVTNSTVSDNSGGGILTRIDSTVTGSTVSGNIGTGIDADTVTVTNTTVSGNTSLDGGGIRVRALVETNIIRNSTITNNVADHAGGGIFANLAAAVPVGIENSIVAGNFVGLGGAGPDLFGPFLSAGHNLIGIIDGGTGFTPGTNGDLAGTLANPLDPRLGPLANNGGPTQTHALLAGSPAIDRGGNGALDPIGLTTDQRGRRRIKDGNLDGRAVIDIGAFER